MLVCLRHGARRFAGVAEGLAALHGLSDGPLIHRDIKPGNLFLCDGGNGDVFVKLLDFGIAKGVDAPLVDSGTKTGAMIGSPFYMSPEQILGSKTIDHRSDLWSVGVVAYEALTGDKPFDAETMGGLAIKIHSEPLPAPSTRVPGLSPAVDAWFYRACARPVTDRFGTAKEMAESLAAALGGEMPRSVDLPRSSTGSNPGPRSLGNDATLAAGATTEAGIVSAMSHGSSRSTRNRVLAVIAFGAVLCLGTFAAVTALKKSDEAKAGHAMTADPPVLTSAPPALTAAPPASAAEPPATLVEPPPADVTSSTASAQPAPPTVKAAGHHGRGKPPLGPSPSSRPPLPSSATTAPAPPPAPTGHDIF
ncbi:MAG: serine/threonine protein kinase [Labilithrix sp.]|nr:serine/threonine protein kinase [Labilithrix sp.]